MFNKTERRDVRFADSQMTHLYEYDDAYRLTFSMGIVADPADPGVPFALTRLTTYDLGGVHNRLSTGGTVLSGPSSPLGSYTMDPAACKDKAMNKYTTTPFDQRSYDANGNLTRILGNDGSGNALAISCLYDYRNRMVEYLDSETLQRHTYTYDALEGV